MQFVNPIPPFFIYTRVSFTWLAMNSMSSLVEIEMSELIRLRRFFVRFPWLISKPWRTLSSSSLHRGNGKSGIISVEITAASIIPHL